MIKRCERRRQGIELILQLSLFTCGVYGNFLENVNDFVFKKGLKGFRESCNESSFV